MILNAVREKHYDNWMTSADFAEVLQKGSTPTEIPLLPGVPGSIDCDLRSLRAGQADETGRAPAFTGAAAF
jgi:hypothetical protein